MASEREMMYLQRVSNFHKASWGRVALISVLSLGSFAGAAAALSESAHAAKKALSAPDKSKIGQAALDSFQGQHKKVQALLAKKASDKALASEVDRLLDYQELAYAALGGKSAYVGACKSECAKFEKALSELIRRNYLRFLRKSDEGRVEYLGAQVGRKGSAVKIKTRVLRKQGKKGARNNHVLVSYILRESSPGVWRAVDVVTEGVSLRKTYRYEFKKILNRSGAGGGIKGVIAKIEAKLAEVAAKL